MAIYKWGDKRSVEDMILHEVIDFKLPQIEWEQAFAKMCARNQVAIDIEKVERLKALETIESDLPIPAPALEPQQPL